MIFVYCFQNILLHLTCGIKIFKLPNLNITSTFTFHILKFVQKSLKREEMKRYSFDSRMYKLVSKQANLNSKSNWLLKIRFPLEITCLLKGDKVSLDYFPTAPPFFNLLVCEMNMLSWNCILHLRFRLTGWIFWP